MQKLINKNKNKKNMKYVLNTNDLNSKGFKVLTDGISVKKDTNIPVFLNHDPDKVLGKWTNLKIEGTELTGEPVWDTNDEETLKYVNKIDKGFIDGVSVGLQFNADDFILNENDELVLTKSVLKEASITPLPANDKARIKEVKELSVVLSATNKEEFNIEDIKAKLSVQHNAIEKQIKDKIETKVEDKVEEVETKVEEPKNKPVKKTKKAKTEDTEETLSFELDEKTLTLSDELISSFNLNKEDNLVLQLTNILTEKDSTITELTNKISTMEKEVETNNINLFLDNALKLGKITKEQKDNYFELALFNFDKVKDIINNSKVNKVNETKLTDAIVNKDELKDYGWYQKNDPSYLKKLKELNRSEYDILKQSYIESLKK